jgi:CRISPR/Cas system-associated exonuclease Cas4 (RecB family)
VIYDWKTSAKKTRRQYLLGRMQTRVYPYLLVQASAFLNQAIPFRPDQVEMIYWFTEAPAEPEVIAYSAEQYQKDGEYLEALAGEIAGLKQDDFNLTPHEERCSFCTYRSLCERGVTAGVLGAAGDGEVETSESEDFNFEQIAEIAFS